jgi:ADP-ribose pyrophosphatase YjhB (NUDIX family)
MYTQKYTKEGREFEQLTAFYRVSLKLLVLDDQDRLLVLHAGDTHMYELPGGGWDHGESLEQALRREVQKELGVELASFDDRPTVIADGLHPSNYSTIKMYFFAKLSSHEFTLEEGFQYKFATRDEFLQLPMPGDESPIQKHADRIWA